MKHGVADNTRNRGHSSPAGRGQPQRTVQCDPTHGRFAAEAQERSLRTGTETATGG